MYDDRTTDYFLYRKPVGKNRHEGKAVIPEQWRKITRMRGMRAAVGIIMRTGICKRVFHSSGTGTSFVYMKPEYTGRTCVRPLRKPLYLHCKQYAANRLIEADRPFNTGILRTALNLRNRFRWTPQQILHIRHIEQNQTPPDYSMPEGGGVIVNSFPSDCKEKNQLSRYKSEGACFCSVRPIFYH